MLAHEARERVDPFVDEDAERVIVGTLLLNPRKVDELDDLGPEHFGSIRPMLAMWAILELEKRRVPVNHKSVADALKDAGKLKDAGGPAELMGYDQLASDLLGFGEGFAEQVARVKDLAVRRKIRTEARAALDGLSDMGRSAAEVALEAAGRLTDLGSTGSTKVPTAADFMERSVQRVELAQQGQGKEKYILTNLKAWDHYIGGVIVRRAIVVAAHPGVGKSGLMNSMALSLADGSPTRHPERVYYGHLEDEGESFADRHLAEHAGLSLRELGSSGLSREALERVFTAQQRLWESMKRIRIDDTRGLNVKQFVARARYYVRNEGIRVVLADHALQLIQDPQRLHEKVWVVMNTLADFAHQENVAVVVAIHLTDPEDKKTQDARYVRPTIQMMAGGRMVDRVARVIVGMRLCPPPRKPPEPPKKKAEPKGDDEEKLAKWRAEQLRAESKYNSEIAQWKERCRLHEKRVLLSAIKANEGRGGFEFWMERIEHAGLFNRELGGAKDGETGFSPAPAPEAAERQPEENAE